MRILIFTFSLLIQVVTTGASAAQGYDGSYQIGKNTWCNGPSSGAAGCWFYGWQQVDTSKLSDVKIETLQSVHYFTMTDKSGNTWSSNFVICSEGQTTACNAQQTDESLTIKFGNKDNSLKIVIEKNEISMLIWASAQHAYLTFDHTKSDMKICMYNGYTFDGTNNCADGGSCAAKLSVTKAKKASKN